MIKHMVQRDIDAVVAIHMSSFPGFFLSYLGPRFLTLYYAGVCTAPEGIALVLTDAGENPVGFVAGASNPSGFYSRLLKRNWLRFSLASLGAMARKPAIVKRLARAFFHPSANPAGRDKAALFSIGVIPGSQKKGIGEKLVQAFLDEAQARGCARVYLTTDRDNNGAVNAFYSKLGFKIERQYVTPEGRNMNEYWIEIRS